jgi:hypothetical protein
MLTRTAFGLVVVLASVSGSLAAPRAPAAVDAQAVHNPSGANVVGSRSGSAPTLWGWPVYVPPSGANVAEPRSHSESTPTLWGWPVYVPPQERAYGRAK